MKNMTLVWSIVAIIYGILLLKNAIWIWKIRELEDAGNEATLWITPKGIGAMDEPSTEYDIRVPDMFSSIFWADSAGFLLAIIAAVLSAL